MVVVAHLMFGDRIGDSFLLSQEWSQHGPGDVGQRQISDLVCIQVDD